MNNNRKIYYIGFNANNAICNDNFFDGSITLYPTGEKGNIFFSNIFVDRNLEHFNDEYSQFIYKNINNLVEINKNIEFTFFNDKIRLLCQNFDNIKFTKTNNIELLEFLNDKFEVRKFFQNLIPIINYEYITSKTRYGEIKKKYGDNAVVLQEKNGAGGDTTYLIENKKDYNTFVNSLIYKEYSISNYIKNIPINITLIIFDDNILFFPISVQLIKVIDNKFKYVGADFDIINNFSKSILTKINDYSYKICKNLQEKGYRGVIGIDYILDKQENIYFMEINPRFQSSSFLLSLELCKKYNSSIAELNYMALNGYKMPNYLISKINKSFLNCNNFQTFDKLKADDIVNNGFFSLNKTSYYRKIYNRSILFEDCFEKINL